MMSRIPSWAVSVVGAIIVIGATLLSSTSLQETRRLIAEGRSEITAAQKKMDIQWNAHRQADERATAGDMFYAETLGQNTNNPLLLGLAADYLMGAVLSMYAAAKPPEQVPDEPPEDIVNSLSKLREGDHGAYLGLKSKINKLRSESINSISKLVEGMRSAELRVRILEAKETRIYFKHVFFNILGLIVVMCKDLPVWKKQQDSRQE